MLKEFGNTDRFMLKLARYIGKLPISPNTWTLLSMIPAVIGFYFAMQQNVIAALILFALSGFLDGVDGAIARHRGSSTKLGGFIDGVSDRFVDFLVVVSFMFILPDFIIPVSWWVIIAAYWALMPTFIVAYANHRGAVDDPKEKVVWRILHRVEMYALWMLAFLVAAFSVQWAMYIFAFTTVMSVITAFQSFFLAIYKSGKQKKPRAL